MIGKINLGTGTLTYQKYFEGNGSYPFPHVIMPYKIELNSNDLLVFGYIRDYKFSSTSMSSFDIFIPVYINFGKSTPSLNYIEINHTDTTHTRGYPSQEPGFLFAWDNLASVFYKRNVSVYTPEVAVKYFDDQSNLQWGMCSYFNNSSPARYDLHFFSSELGECDPLERDLEIGDWPENDIDMVFDNFDYTTVTRMLSKTTLSLSDDDCGN